MVPGVVARIAIALCMAVLSAACALAPPGPSEATVRLLDSLLTAADLGPGFTEDFRGEAGESGGMICPDSDHETEAAGVVRVSFVREGNPSLEVTETLRAIETPGDWFAILRSAYVTCDGTVWTDYGDTQTVSLLEIPGFGNDSFAVVGRHGEPPFDGPHDNVRTVFVRYGEVLLMVGVTETLESSEVVLSMSDAELLDIVAGAVARLP